MEFDLEKRWARLGVGELSDFGVGPRESGEGGAGLWRVQLGNHWHARLREQTTTSAPTAEFEVGVAGAQVVRGWTIELEGRIDQLLRSGDAVTLREIKTVVRPLPEDDGILRSDYPAYFVQLAAYAALLTPTPVRLEAELVFVEVTGGLVQTIPLTPADTGLWRARLEAVADFLDRRLQARERRRTLRFAPPFSALRPGQEEVQARLAAAFQPPHGPVLLEAPTGFGKTGVLLEFALGRLRSGEFDRVIYLTGKSTGQLQVARTLDTMLAPPSAGLGVWTVRPKAEHCVNTVFQCLSEACGFLNGMAERWPQSGLDRLYLFPDQPHDLATLRAAGQAALICPYEITRAGLAFADLWLGDYNYVFAPGNRTLFYQQPGFQPERTLLLLDEAHNLPSRVAGAYSHELAASDAALVREALADTRAPSDLALAWEAWTAFLANLPESPALTPEDEADARTQLRRLADLIGGQPLDYVALGPRVSEFLWQIPSLINQLESQELPRLWWSPRPGLLALTCLDAAAAIGPIVREFGSVIFATATPGPLSVFAEAVGLAEPTVRRPAAVPPEEAPKRLGDLNQRETKKLFKQVSTGAGLLQLEEVQAAAAVALVEAHAPWRVGAYDVACDLRVDTRYRTRAQHYSTTADTLADLCASARSEPGKVGVSLRTAAFFSSYAYAEAIARELAERRPEIRYAVQPRRVELSAQAAWVEECFLQTDVLFLILGSSFAESIDLLGGRVTHAMVVGPALPEVSPVQRARQNLLAGLGAEAAFSRVYQVPGMQKVNQALGRLVRAPGQHAKILLHCRRFAETSYSRLLAPDYQQATRIETDLDLADWLRLPPPVQA